MSWWNRMLYWMILYCIVVGSRRLMPSDELQPKSFLLAPPGVSTRDPSSERRNYLGENFGRWFRPKAATSTHTLSGSFTYRKYATWDKRLYFHSEGRRAEDFFALKNPTVLAGVEPANLGTKSQHATSLPPNDIKLDWRRDEITLFLWITADQNL